jgi:hypothetical protein
MSSEYAEKETDSYVKLKNANYQLYRDAIQYTEAVISVANTEDPKVNAKIEGLLVAFALHVLSMYNLEDD